MASCAATTLVGDQQQLDSSPQLRKSCDYCVRMKRGCDGGTPCELCTRRNKECIRSVKKRSGPAKGTKYCKRKPRKTANAASSGSLSSSSSKSSASASGAGGASAAATANTPSGGSSAGHCPLPPGSSRGAGKTGVTKTRPSHPKRIKREGGAVAAGRGRGDLLSNRASMPHATGMNAPGAAATTAAAALGGLPPKHEGGAATAFGGAVGIDPSPQQQQHVRWRGQEYGGADADRGGKIQPGGLVGGGGGGIGTHRRGSSATFDSYSSRRSSLGSMAGFGGGLDGDRRYSLEVDACSGTLLPFYFAPAESEGGGGGAGGSGDAAAWAGGGDLSGGGVGGGRVVAEDGSGGGGIAEAEQAAMMMAARRSSLEEALYGACYKRTSFSNAWGQPPSSTLAHQQHPHPHHRHVSSADGPAWNSLLQQADTAAIHEHPGQGQGANSGPGGGGGSDDPAGGKMMSTSHPLAFHSPALISGGQEEGQQQPQKQQQQQQQQQQSSTSMRPPSSTAAMVSSFEAHHAGEAGGGGGDGSSSTMPSLRDLLFDTGNSARWPPPPIAPPSLNEMSLVESSS